MGASSPQTRLKCFGCKRHCPALDTHQSGPSKNRVPLEKPASFSLCPQTSIQRVLSASSAPRLQIAAASQREPGPSEARRGDGRRSISHCCVCSALDFKQSVRSRGEGDLSEARRGRVSQHRQASVRAVLSSLVLYPLKNLQTGSLRPPPCDTALIESYSG